MQLFRPDPAGYSVLEQSIRLALREHPRMPEGARLCRF
jgi:hypothetical protein